MKPWRKIVHRQLVDGESFVDLECGHRIKSVNRSRARCYSCHPPQQQLGYPHVTINKRKSLGFDRGTLNVTRKNNRASN
jgi:hypothetical protein